MNASRARVFFGATAAAVFAGLVIQVLVVATAAHSPWSSIPARIFNVFCFFTVQSNVMLAVTCLLIAVRLDRPSTTFRVFRHLGLVAITITGIVYHVALAHLVEFDSWALAADQLLHTVAPIAAVAQAGIPGATRVVLTNGGHMPQLEVPESFNHCVEQFRSTLP